MYKMNGTAEEKNTFQHVALADTWRSSYTGKIVSRRRNLAQTDIILQPTQFIVENSLLW